MDLAPEVIGQVFALAPQQRYTLAQQLLDSIDEQTASELDREFLADLQQRRNDMLSGNEVVADWQAALLTISQGLMPEKSRFT
ncbi:MAG: addiction module protein [Pirellulales bacterium]